MGPDSAWDGDVALVDEEHENLRNKIQALLRQFNDEASDVRGPDPESLCIRATSSSSEFVGGLVAETYWGWLVIDVLAVDPMFLRRGLGKRMVELAEETAVGRGCTRAYTQAWAFQGLGFWRRMGYRVVGQLEDYPEGHIYYWVCRDLKEHR